MRTKLRWLIWVVAARCYKKPLRISQDLAQRQRALSKDIQGIAWQAQVRLHKRYWHLVNSGKNNKKATVAIVRELVGFVWDVYRAVPIH